MEQDEGRVFAAARCKRASCLPCFTLFEETFYDSSVIRRFVGIDLGTGIIVDATIIQAPISTKSEESRRDPEMQQTPTAIGGAKDGGADGHPRDETRAELAKTFELHTNQIVQWKQDAVENTTAAFAAQQDTA